MSLFRSEEHIRDYLHTEGWLRGQVLTLDRVWKLAKAWYTDPLNPSWRPRTIAENQELLRDVGLTDDFWTLPS